MDAIGNNGSARTSGAVVVAAAPVPPSDDSPARTGGPSLLIADLICEGVASGMSQAKVAEQLDIPDSTISYWVIHVPWFRQIFEGARCQRYDRMAEECLVIADDTSNDNLIGPDGFRRPNKEWIARSRVRIQTRLDLLARWDPFRYGAKLQVNAKVNSHNLNINFDGGDVAAAAAYADLLRGG